MRKIFTNDGNEIMILHFPGSSKVLDKNKNILKEFVNFSFNKPDNIGFVTPYTENTKDDAYLIHQLENNNYKFYNSIQNLSIDWYRNRKINFIYDSLKLCDKEYSLVLDTADVVITSDLTNILEKFELYKEEFPKLKILYNATSIMYPQKIVERIKNKYRYGKYCNLNAGCCIGKTSDLIEFYHEAKNLVDENEDSEQYYIRKAFANHMDEVWFDYKRLIFQTHHSDKYTKEINKETGEEKCILL